MRLRFVLPVVLLSCAEPSPPPAPPRQPTLSDQQVQQAQFQQQLAAMQAQNEQAQRAQYAAAAAQQAANAKAMQDVADKANAARDAQRKADEDALRQRCDASRVKRVENARWAARQRVDLEYKLKTRSREVTAACKLVDRPTGAVNIQRSGGGLRVSREMQDDVVCARGVPSGFTKQVVYVVLWRIRDGSGPSVSPSDEILASEDHEEDDAACRGPDAEAGVDLYVTYKDADGLKRLLTWKPASSSPTPSSSP